MRTLDKVSARAAGYRALTHSYFLPQEQEWLDNVLADMRRGGIDHVLVRQPGGLAVWRRGSNWRGA